MSKILIIEDDEHIRNNVLDLLEAEGFEGIGANDGETGVKLAVKHLPALIICDVMMPGIDGFEVLEILSMKPGTAIIPFIFLSARAERSDIRRGMSLGADDYITKPFTRSELLEAIGVRLQRRQARASNLANEKRSSSEVGSTKGSTAHLGPRIEQRLVVVDPEMQALFAQIDRIAEAPIAVLILGETGVGKEIIAEHIHNRSGRQGRFVALNCAALTESLIESELFGHEKGAFTGAIGAKEGLFESADGGTIFLDEVGELPAAIQVKLLRVLEDHKMTRVGGRTARKIDVRFVSATNRNIEHEADQGSGFRQDLYFRLSGVTFQVPPLRRRQADIAPLAQAFAIAGNRAIARDEVPEFSQATLELLERYDWPGNIRELRNIVERAVLLCDGAVIEPSHLPPKLVEPARSTLAGHTSSTTPVDPREHLLSELERLERERIVDALARCGGNQTQAAEKLGISRRTLVTRLRTHDLPRPRKHT